MKDSPLQEPEARDAVIDALNNAITEDQAEIAKQLSENSKLRSEVERLRALTEEQNGGMAIMRGVLERQRTAVIEECAQVAERFMKEQRSKGMFGARAIEVLTVAVDAIRVLKEKQ